MALVVGASTGALRVVLPMLAKMLGDEYRLQKGVKDGIQYLHKELENLQIALEKVSEVQPDELDLQVKLWARELRDMSYRIQDTIASYMEHVDAASKSGSSTSCCVNVKGALQRSWLCSCYARRNIATEIQRIRTEVEDVSRRRERWKVDGVAAPPALSDPRIRYLFEDKEKLVGIDSSSTEITKLLSMEGEGTSEQKLKLVSIVGPAGVGKTTLANVVYEKFEDKFDCTAFVSVSLKPDIKNIYNSILRQVSSKIRDVPMDTEESIHRQESERYNGGTHGLSLHEVMIKIVRVLKHKRYLIVVDDIWNEGAWEDIKCVLAENNFGSKIITTSRNFDVAKLCGSWDRVDGSVHELQPLSDVDSLSLFRHKIFRGDADCTNFDYTAVQRIIEKCKGLPLAIVTIASLLANKPIDQWGRVINSISTGLETNDAVKAMHFILGLSYRDMPPQLRTCLLYLSIFSEDQVIGRDDLIWKWIAENFLPARQDDNPYELGDKCFNELINRSMIQPIHVDSSGRAHACRVHDVVLEFITSLAAEENFVTVMNGQPFPSNQESIHRLSLRGSGEEHRVPQSIKKLPHVRTLVVSSHAIDLMPSLLIFPVLRVLDLEHCTSGNIVGLEHLVYLRYLRLEISLPTWEKKYLKRLFKSVRKLKNLEALYIFAQDLSLDFMQVDWATAHLRKLTVCARPQTEYIIKAGSTWSEFSPFSTLPRWINSSLSSLSDLSIIVTILRQEDLDMLASLSVLRSVDLEVTDGTRDKLVVTSATGHAAAFRCLASLRFTSRAVRLVFRGGAMRKLQQLVLSFALAEISDVHDDFDFGLENLISLNAVDVLVDCRCAKVWQMQAAEAELNNATNNINPDKHILRLTKHFEAEMYWDEKAHIPVTDTKEMKEEEQARVTRTGLWGGNSGQFRDTSVVPSHLLSVTICGDEVINTIEYSYVDHSGKQHAAGPWGGAGGHNGDHNTIMLVPSEFLIGVSGTANRYRHAPGYVITSLTLVTNARSYGPFGGGGGVPFNSPMQRNGSIVGFFTRTGWFVDAIGFYLNAEQTMQDEEEACLAKIGPWGSGDIGYLRDIRVPPCYLQSIIIRSGKVIISLAFSYSDNSGQQHAAGPWGGDGPGDAGCNHTILLGNCEFLREVSGTMDLQANVITSLFLVTSARRHGPFGEGGGTPFHTPAESNASIVSFFARAGQYINAIGFYVSNHKEKIKHGHKGGGLAKIGPWGGTNGKPYDVRVPPCRLESVTICSDEIINSLAFSYTDQNGQHHTAGPWGNGPFVVKNRTISLGPSEYLIEVYGTMDRYIHAPAYVITSVTLVTNARSYGPFGRGGGGVPFNTPVQRNGSIVGFFTRAGWFVDAIGVYVHPLPV